MNAPSSPSRNPSPNPDPVDVAIGLAEARDMDITDEVSMQMLRKALLLWSQGDEIGAQIKVFSDPLVPIDELAWKRILSAAIAGGYRSLNQRINPRAPVPQKDPSASPSAR